MITCKKIYLNIPFAHRQPNHTGNCGLLHGHTWSIQLTIGAHALDACCFVLDLGDMKYIKDWIHTHLDHACVLAATDPLIELFRSMQPAVCKLYVVEHCSCEGMALHLGTIFNEKILQHSNNRAFLVAIEVSEDSVNSARYEFKAPLFE